MVSYLQNFEYVIHIYVQKVFKKIRSKNVKANFVGYCINIKAYYF